MKFKQIMVLNDGETYTNIEGCSIVAVPASADMEEIAEILDAIGSSDTNAPDDTEGFTVAVFGEVA